MTRRWAVRLAVLAVGDLILIVGLRWIDFDPDPLRLSLLVIAVVALAWLVADTATDSGPPWTVQSRSVASGSGTDARLATYTRIIEDHVAARAPNASLRDRLATLAAQRLELHHGLELDDPAAVEMLGPELTAVLTGPPRRLRPAELDDFVTRIEEL